MKKRENKETRKQLAEESERKGKIEWMRIKEGKRKEKKIGVWKATWKTCIYK